MNSIVISFSYELEKRLSEDQPLVQVVLGPRQVGKTTGVLQCLDRLKKFPQIYVSADEYLSPGPSWIEEQWQKALEISDKTILVMDEIQKVPQWSSILKKLWDEQKRKKQTWIKPVLLGSASLSIQKGLIESLTGRFELLRVYHWNYTDTHKLCGWSLEKYLQWGGYPGSYPLAEESARFREYIVHSILETVIGKDILLFSRVRSPALFRQAFEILSQYPACEMSYNKLLGQLQEKGNVELIKYYIELYEGAFLLKTLQKFSSKTYLKKSSSPKILPLCPALVTGMGFSGNIPEERGRLFEMVVGTELLRLNGELTYWREGDFEVDYVLKLGTKIYAIEVKSGRKKNSRGLEAFRKKFSKAIVLFITPENFVLMSRNPLSFLEKFS